MACEYCEDDSRKNITKYNTLSAYVFPDGMMRIEFFDDYLSASLEADINFCPMCGCDLRGDNQ